MAVREEIKNFFSKNRNAFSQGLTSLTISSLADLIAGVTLGYMTNTLELLPGLMILIPPAIGMRGNIFGAVGSRLGTAFHLGSFELTLKRGSVLRQNLQSSLILTMLISFLMGILAWIVSALIGLKTIGIEDFVVISVVGGALAGFVLIFINILIAYAGYKRSWDIDNISAPLITAAGDIVTLPMLLVGAMIVLGFQNIGFKIAIDFIGIVLLSLTIGVLFLAYKSDDREVQRILKESSPVLIFCILLDLGAGLTLDHQLEDMIALPALLILIPPFLEECNALGGILSSRLSSRLHMGFLEPGRVPGRDALENFGIIYICGLWAFTVVGVSTYFVAIALEFESPGLVEMMGISITSGMLAVTVLNLFTYYISVYTFRFSLNPDNLSIPLTSSFIDLIGALILMGVFILFGFA